MLLTTHLYFWRHQPAARQSRRQYSTSRLRVEELESRQLLTLLPTPTTASIGVIEDQLDLVTPSPQVTFVATHADGTQKRTSEQNQLFLNINPNWYLLQYQLGTGNSVYSYIIHDNWAQDFDPSQPNFVNNPPAGPGGVTSHEDWFEHSDGSLNPATKGNRLVDTSGLYLANIDSAGWRNYELTTLVGNMLATGAKGVFADSFAGPLYGFYTNQGDKRYDYGGPIPGPADPSLWPGGETWITKAENYMSWIQGQLTAVGEALYGPGGGFPYLPNAGQMTTGWADVDYSAAKGVFAEGFSVWNQPITGADWVLSMDRALRITSTSNPANADRMFIMQPYPSATPDSPQGLEQRSWAMGSYLLLKGDHTYINISGAGVASRLEWYPEYQVNLGPAVDPNGMPLTVDGYYDPSSQLYRRYFQNGLVLVNNSPTSLVYQTDKAMQQVIVNGWGGGVRDGDIDAATNRYTAGWLSSQLVSTVTVAPFSSVILINPDQPIEAVPPPPGGRALLISPPVDTAIPATTDLGTASASVGSGSILFGTITPVDIGGPSFRNGLPAPGATDKRGQELLSRGSGRSNSGGTVSVECFDNDLSKAEQMPLDCPVW